MLKRGILLIAFVGLLCSTKVALAAHGPKKVHAEPDWDVYVSSSPNADLARRPNLSFEYRFLERFTVALKGSVFLNANEVFGWGFIDGRSRLGTATSKGFEIGPQVGYLFNFIWGTFLQPRIGVYRSIVHFSGGTGTCSDSYLGACGSPDSIDGWVGEAMAMVHAPITSHFHLEAGAGFVTENSGLILELNMGYAGF